MTGNIQCSCGNKIFEVLESNERHIVKAVCSECRKEILLFDAGKHGWNGFVCNEEDYLDRSLPFQKYVSSKSKKDTYLIIMYISSQGKEDFLEECMEFEDGFLEEDWVNAFESIAIALSNEEEDFWEENWVNFETM